VPCIILCFPLSSEVPGCAVPRPAEPSRAADSGGRPCRRGAALRLLSFRCWRPPHRRRRRRYRRSTSYFPPAPRTTPAQRSLPPRARAVRSGGPHGSARRLCGFGHLRRGSAWFGHPLCVQESFGLARPLLLKALPSRTSVDSRVVNDVSVPCSRVRPFETCERHSQLNGFCEMS